MKKPYFLRQAAGEVERFLSAGFGRGGGGVDEGLARMPWQNDVFGATIDFWCSIALYRKVWYNSAP